MVTWAGFIHSYNNLLDNYHIPDTVHYKMERDALTQHSYTEEVHSSVGITDKNHKIMVQTEQCYRKLSIK